MTKTETLLKAFKAGKKLTSAQITDKFGLMNPTAAIHGLRNSGHSIIFNKKVKAKSYFQMVKPILTKIFSSKK